MNKHAGFGAVLLLVFLAIGCGDNREAKVVGRVTIDGEPLTHGTVAFLAGSKTNAPAATGAIQSDGSYCVQTGQSGKLISGEYAARVTASEPSIPDPEGGPPTPGALITPVRYADIRTSGLRYNIRSGENVIDIALVSDGPEADGPEADGPEADGPASPLGEDSSKSEAAHQDATGSTGSIKEESEKKEKEGP